MLPDPRRSPTFAVCLHKQHAYGRGRCGSRSMKEVAVTQTAGFESSCRSLLARLPRQGCDPAPLEIGTKRELEALRSALSFYVSASGGEVPLKAKRANQKFPIQYCGWIIERLRGVDFGKRGLAKNKTGYRATCKATGEVQNFEPSYDAHPSVDLVRKTIDVKNAEGKRGEAQD